MFNININEDNLCLHFNVFLLKIQRMRSVERTEGQEFSVVYGNLENI